MNTHPRLLGVYITVVVSYLSILPPAEVLLPPLSYRREIFPVERVFKRFCARDAISSRGQTFRKAPETRCIVGFVSRPCWKAVELDASGTTFSRTIPTAALGRARLEWFPPPLLQIKPCWSFVNLFVRLIDVWNRLRGVATLGRRWRESVTRLVEKRISR